MGSAGGVLVAGGPLPIVSGLGVLLGHWAAGPGEGDGQKLLRADGAGAGRWHARSWPCSSPKTRIPAPKPR